MPNGRLRVLRSFALVAALAFLAPLARADDDLPPPVASVAAVDLARYLGKWYEIASFPLFFQSVCRGDTSAEYALRDDGDISVTNRCRSGNGFSQIVGRAWTVEDSGNARLKVQFFWPFRGDYWVIGLDPDYRWAVVGNPNRRYLWILSRTPALPAEALAAALQAASAQHFDLTRLHYTVHGEAAAATADEAAPPPAVAAPAGSPEH
jgi:apolipoprotein D and lipocalin family protein